MLMRILDRRFLQSLNQSEADSKCKRAHLNLHSILSEKVQRLLIALKLGSYIEPRYHEFPHQWEMFVVTEGVVEVIFYTDKGKVRRSLLGDSQDCKVIAIHPFYIHSV